MPQGGHTRVSSVTPYPQLVSQHVLTQPTPSWCRSMSWLHLPPVGVAACPDSTYPQLVSQHVLAPLTPSWCRSMSWLPYPQLVSQHVLAPLTPSWCRSMSWLPLPPVGVAACPGSTPAALSSALSGAGVTSASVWQGTPGPCGWMNSHGPDGHGCCYKMETRH